MIHDSIAFLDLRLVNDYSRSRSGPTASSRSRARGARACERAAGPGHGGHAPEAAGRWRPGQDSGTK